MNITIDHATLLRDLGAYAFGVDVPAELAGKLQYVQGSPVDRIFTAIEILYAFRDQLGDAGLTLLGQLTGFARANRWDVPGQLGRLDGIYQGVLRDLGEPGSFPPVEDDPEPVTAYRQDGINWKSQLEPDLAALKTAAWDAVKKLREEKENSTAPTQFGAVQCDDHSKINIMGMVQMASIAKQNAQPFSEEFAMADDSVVALDADMAIAMGMDIAAYVSAVFARARQLRAEIDAAATFEALQAIDIAAGWPA